MGCKMDVANLKSADIQLEETHEISCIRALLWNGDFQNIKQECNHLHSYARNPTIRNIGKVFNPFHSYVRDQTVSKGTLLGSLETERFISRKTTDLCVIERISLCSGSMKKNNFIFIRKHGVRVKKIFFFFFRACCWCCCCFGGRGGGCVCVCVRGRASVRAKTHISQHAYVNSID
jgi:hypothetical protein